MSKDPKYTEDRKEGITRANDNKQNESTILDDIVKSPEALEEQKEAFTQQKEDILKSEGTNPIPEEAE